MARTTIIDYTTRELVPEWTTPSRTKLLAAALVAQLQETYKSAQADLDVTTDPEAANYYAGVMDTATELLSQLTIAP